MNCLILFSRNNNKNIADSNMTLMISHRTLWKHCCDHTTIIHVVSVVRAENVGKKVSGKKVSGKKVSEKKNPEKKYQEKK